MPDLERCELELAGAGAVPSRAGATLEARPTGTASRSYSHRCLDDEDRHPLQVPIPRLERSDRTTTVLGRAPG